MLKKTKKYRQVVVYLLCVLNMLMSRCTGEDMLDLMDAEKRAATTAFPGTENAPYWTSTEWTFWGAAVYVDFKDGTVNADVYPGNLHYVRCVANADSGGTGTDPQEFHSVYFPIASTGQHTSYLTGDDGYYEELLPDQNFINNGDGTVTDQITGLLWMRCSLGEEGNPDALQLCTGVHGKYEWADAINACLNLEFAGRNDWVLPTFSELSSLVDYGKENPAIP